MLQERLDFRSKGEQTAVPEVVERLDSQPVARAKELLRVAVPDRKRKHSTELLHAIRAVLFVSVEDRFGVTAGDVAMAGGFQIDADIGMIEDFAVVNDTEGAVLIGHRLMAGGYVDDAESSMG